MITSSVWRPCACAVRLEEEEEEVELNEDGEGMEDIKPGVGGEPVDAEDVELE